MLKVFSSSAGIDVFSRNSYNYLIHQWSRAPHPNSFSYRMVARDVVGEPDINVTEQYILISFINNKNELIHIQIKQQQLYKSNHRILARNVNRNIAPSSCHYKDHSLVYFIDGEGKLIQSKIKIDSEKGDEKRSIDEERIKINMLRAIKTAKGEPYIFYQKNESVCWMSQKGGNKTPKNNLKIPFPFNQNQKYEIVDKDQHFHMFLVSKTGQIHQTILDEENQMFISSKAIGEDQVLPYIPMSVTKNEKDLCLWFISGKSRITCYSQQAKRKEWIESHYLFEEKIGRHVEVAIFNSIPHIFVLDNKQIVSKYQMIINDAKTEFIKAQQLPYLLWEQVQHKSKGIGRGYWTDVFYNKQLQKAIKKFRNSDHASKVHQEIKNLQKMQEIEPEIVSHRVFQKGVLKGFTLPLMKGRPWHQILKNPNSLIHKSPIARVKLVIALAKHIRDIQSLNLCHGDIHIGNIMLNVQQDGDAINPSVWAKVIDFGNAFQMKQGQLVSNKGLTGARNLIPPEIRACHQNNYNPYSYNPYQLLINSLMILLRQNFNGEFYPEKKLQQLKKHNQYPEEIKIWLRELMSSDKKKQSEALNKDIQYFEDLTRAIYRTNLQKDPNNIVALEGQKPSADCGCHIM